MAAVGDTPSVQISKRTLFVLASWGWPLLVFLLALGLMLLLGPGCAGHMPRLFGGAGGGGDPRPPETPAAGVAWDVLMIHVAGVLCIVLAIASAIATAWIPKLVPPRVTMALVGCGVAAFVLAFIIGKFLLVLVGLAVVAVALAIAHVALTHRNWWTLPTTPAKPAGGGA